MKRRIALAVVATSVAAFAPPAAAQNSGSGGMQHGAMMDHATQAMSEGEVRKLDKSAKKITIKHGPLANLDMPAMTMVFRVKDPALLENVKPGDKVKFEAEKVDGHLTVLRLEPTK